MYEKDADLRGALLEKFYEFRAEGELLNPLSPRFSPLDTLGRRVITVCEHLSQKGLIKWTSATSMTGYGGFGRITAAGVDVVEGNVAPPIAIAFHQHGHTVMGSSNVQIGDQNTIISNAALDKFINAIDGSIASDEQKREAKSLIEKVLDNPILKGIVGLLGHHAGGD